MKLLGTKQELIKRWEAKADLLFAMGKIEVAEAIYRCALELSIWNEDNDSTQE
jgi:hypothetical protein